MSREKQTYNPHCIVAYCHWEATGKVLYCEDCVIKDCECKKLGFYGQKQIMTREEEKKTMNGGRSLEELYEVAMKDVETLLKPPKMKGGEE